MAKIKEEQLKVSYMVVCDYAFVGEGGKLGVVGIFDILGGNRFPLTHPELFVVANLKGKDNSEHFVELKILDEQDKNLLPVNFPKLKVKLSGTGGGNLIQRFLGVSFNQAGKYRVVLLSSGKEISKTTLTVMKVSADVAGQSNGKDNLPN